MTRLTSHLLAVAMLACLALAGCQSQPSNIPDVPDRGESVNLANVDAARIDEQAKFIVDAALRLPASVDRDLIAKAGGLIGTGAANIAARLDKAQDDMRQMDGERNNLRSDLRDEKTRRQNDKERYEAQIYTLNHQFWSPTQIRWAWIIGGGAFLFWAGGGVLSIIAPIIWPVWGLGISKMIVRFLPAANLFSRVRDRAMPHPGLT